MVETKVEFDRMDRFNGDRDFSMWKIRMMAHLGTLGLKAVLTDEKLLKEYIKEELAAAKEKGIEPTIDPIKVEKSDKAKDLIVLNVGNRVLRKISHCETAASMWSLLNSLYTETYKP